MPLAQFLLLCLALPGLVYVIYRLMAVGDRAQRSIQTEPLMDRRQGDRRSGHDRRHGTRRGASAGRRDDGDRRYAMERLKAVNDLAI